MMHLRSGRTQYCQCSNAGLALDGDVDQRVPPSQGRDYYHVLKAWGGEGEMPWFPENNYALDKVEAERVSWEVQWEWFEKRKVI